MAFNAITFKYCISASDIIRNSLKVTRTSFKADVKRQPIWEAAVKPFPIFFNFCLNHFKQRKMLPKRNRGFMKQNIGAAETGFFFLYPKPFLINYCIHSAVLKIKFPLLLPLCQEIKSLCKSINYLTIWGIVS